LSRKASLLKKGLSEKTSNGMVGVINRRNSWGYNPFEKLVARNPFQKRIERKNLDGVINRLNGCGSTVAAQRLQLNANLFRKGLVATFPAESLTKGLNNATQAF
jgi:hypothetical protein